MIRSPWSGALVVVLACTAPGWGQVLQQERLVVVREEGKPPVQCRVVKCWKEKDGSRVCQVQPVGGGEVMTILEETIPAAPTAVASGRITPKPGGTTPAAAEPTRVSTIVRNPGDKTTLLGRVFGVTESRQRVTMTEVPPPLVQAEVVPASPGSDPRRSWGMADRSVKTGDTRTASRPTAATPGSESVTAPATSASRFRLPVARQEKYDPLTQPEALTKGMLPTDPTPTGEVRPMTGSENGSRLMNGLKGIVGGKRETRSGVTTEAVVQTSKGASTGPVATKTDTTGPVATTGTVAADKPGVMSRLLGKGSSTRQAKAAPAGDLPPGYGSVLAANAPQVETRSTGWFGFRKSKPEAPEALVAGPYISLPMATANAFTAEMPVQSGPRMPPAGMMGGMAMGYPGMSHPGMMQAGMAHPGMMHPGMMPASMGHPGMMQAGMMHPGMMQAAAMPPMAGYGAASYPTMPVGYAPAAMTAAAGPLAGAAPGRAVISDQESTTLPLLQQLRDSLLPSEREMAAERLARADWRNEPQVVQALLTAAKTDPAPVVRACCVRSLGKMKVNLVPVLQAVQSLKSDGDLRVQQEVEQTLAILNAP